MDGICYVCLCIPVQTSLKNTRFTLYQIKGTVKKTNKLQTSYRQYHHLQQRYSKICNGTKIGQKGRAHLKVFFSPSKFMVPVVYGTSVVDIVWQLDLQLPMQSVPITSEVVCSNLVHYEVYSIQLYVIKFGSDLQQVGGFLQVLQFPAPIKLTATI